jgi:hypothetical protein
VNGIKTVHGYAEPSGVALGYRRQQFPVRRIGRKRCVGREDCTVDAVEEWVATGSTRRQVDTARAQDILDKIRHDGSQEFRVLPKLLRRTLIHGVKDILEFARGELPEETIFYRDEDRWLQIAMTAQSGRRRVTRVVRARRGCGCEKRGAVFVTGHGESLGELERVAEWKQRTGESGQTTCMSSEMLDVSKTN